jgi:atypical dual specificity phosphatase
MPRSLSWVIPGKLAVGGLPLQGDEAIFAHNGIQAVLSLCDNSEGELPIDIQQGFECRQLTLPDSHYAYALEVQQIAQAVELIQQNIQKQIPVYVHCLAGVERSPTICAAYLCRYYNLELWEAINWLKQAHPNSMPTTAQVQVLREFINQFCQPQKAQHPKTSP